MSGSAVFFHSARRLAKGWSARPGAPMAKFLDQLEPGLFLHAPDVLFAKVTDEQIVQWKDRFGGDDMGVLAVDAVPKR